MGAGEGGALEPLEGAEEEGEEGGAELGRVEGIVSRSHEDSPA